MHYLRLLLLLFTILFASSVSRAEPVTGIIIGGTKYTLPNWFKDSFLDFEDDIETANENGKHVLAYMHLDECPYCERMLKENFTEGETKEFIQKNFEVIGINVRGNLDVTWINGNTYTEFELARHLKIFGTPTMVFFDTDNNKLLQLNGYRDPHAFRYALEYVQKKAYNNQSFAKYLETLEKPEVYALRDHSMLQPVNYLKGYDKPLLILFEDKHCQQCERFHEKTLNHPRVLAKLKDYLFVRFDTDSKQKIIDLEGKVITAKEWYDKIGMNFHPSLILLNEGKEKFRTDGIIYHQHMIEGLAYVNAAYKEYKTIRDFKPIFREQLMKQGKNIDFSE